jgi:predicted metal-binding membrane protein
VFAAGYLAVWLAFAAVATLLQFALERLALLSPMMETTSTTLAGILLLAGGLYQWTPLKQSCLRRCRSPMEFLMTRWRPGTRGAFAMGAVHGIYCVGCCWVLMLLLFVGGVMDMAWITALAAFVLFEKLLPHGRWLGMAAGALLAGWGIALLMRLPA